MTAYSALLLSLSAAGVIFLICVAIRESLAEFRSARIFASLAKISSNVDVEVARQAIRLAQEWTATLRPEVRVAAEGQEFREPPGPSTGEGTAQAKGKPDFNEYSGVIRLLIRTFVPESINKQEFPIRAFARHDWKDRSRIAEVLVLLRADREISKAQRS